MSSHTGALATRPSEAFLVTLPIMVGGLWTKIQNEGMAQAKGVVLDLSSRDESKAEKEDKSEDSMKFLQATCFL